MKRQTKRHRIIATFFLLIFFPTLIPTNLFASTTGPKSPEAASFEPVDATDMVNLVTGQYSYVLPLLNVPSPEGGYPIALGYHAGIAMDQEASWAGLGWNVNPGSIDRNVNGYPDDYNASKLNEYFWDRTHTETFYSASLGFMSVSGVSVGVGLNWGSNQALGGSVNIGVGPEIGAFGVGANISMGTNGASLGVGVSMEGGGLSYGASISSNGNVGVNLGYGNNDAGMSIGYNTSGQTSIGINQGTGNDNSFGLDVSFSSSGVGISGGVTNKTGKKIDGGAGSGFYLSFNNTMSMGDYSSSSSGWMIPIVVPTPIGIFSASFGKQKFKYWMGKNVNNFVTSPLYFHKGIIDITKWVTVQKCVTDYDHYDEYGNYAEICTDTLVEKLVGRSFMDINEISLSENGFNGTTNVGENNMTFPNYDNFSVNGQGISGSMSATIYKNGALFGLDGKENKAGYSLKYNVRNETASGADFTKFNNAPQFEFENEITTYLGVEPAQFNTNNNNTSILDYYSTGIDLNDKPRRKTSNYIEYFTNKEINTPATYAILKSNGFLQPTVSGFDRSIMPEDGIGAFKVTTVDGKTYHYSLPIYNHEIITRTHGVIPDSPDESQSYFEKRQLEPFATHWLLTAVTGPDFVDNGDGIAGEGDLGYWVNFEYGKWTDAFVWKNPYKKDYFSDPGDQRIKTWIRGRKQLYYLDKIKTRTHSAIFIKGEREDARSEQWNYSSAKHIDDLQSNSVKSRFTVPEQKQLRLEKIIVLKNEDSPTNKGHEIYAPNANAITLIKYNQSEIKENVAAEYNMYDNVFDNRDNLSSYENKALQVIDFNYGYSLVPGDNRLTLKSVVFKGKGGETVLPPYKFDYINDTNTFNIDKKDDWGYLRGTPYMYSLNRITTPQGGTIEVSYEKNKCKSVIGRGILEFKYENYLNYRAYDVNHTTHTAKISIGDDFQNYNLLGKKVNVGYYINVCKQSNELYNKYYYNEDTGIISSYLGNGIYEVHFDNSNVNSYDDSTVYSAGDCFIPDPNAGLRIALFIDPNEILDGGGPRVASLKISDGIDNYITDYKYGENEDGVGYVSYVPYDQYLAQEVPYSAELPAPRVMYEFVTTSSHKEGVIPEVKLRYKFNIMKEQTGITKFGEFYEIIQSVQYLTNSSNNNSVTVKSFTVKENFAAIGQLLEVSTLNSKNQLLSKLYNSYYGINEIPNNIGVTKESYQTYKAIDFIDSAIKDKWYITSSSRIKYPSIVKSSTEKKNGYSYTTDFNDYDLVSGISKEQVYTSSDGQSYKTRIVPAYTKYSTSGGYGMGSKVDDPTNKNMLSQTAAEYSYILDKGTSTWKVTGVGITTWSNIWSYKDITGAITTPSAAKEKIWRKHKIFVWNGVKDSNGIFTNYNSANDDGFNWTVGVGSQPSQWKQVSETSLYDHFSAPLEIKDINGNLASTKMGDNDTKVMVTGNAGYNEIYYTGAENAPPLFALTFLEPEIKMVNALRNVSYFHTGKQSVETTSASQFGITMQNAQHRPGKYKVSVWVKADNAAKAQLKLNGIVVPFVSDNIIAGNWQLKTAFIDVPTGACTVYLNSSDTSTVYYDDLMIRPVASSITGYVYNEWDELSYIIANNGLATKFEYDAAGRLIKTYSEVIDDSNNGITGGFKLMKSYKMNNKYLN